MWKIEKSDCGLPDYPIRREAISEILCSQPILQILQTLHNNCGNNISLFFSQFFFKITSNFDWLVKKGSLCRTLDGHAHWVNTLALNSDYIIRTGAFDPKDATLVKIDTEYSS